MEQVLAKKSLPKWIEKLHTYEIVAPVQIEGHWDYQRVDKPGQITLEHIMTVHSAKKFVFPQREVYLEFCLTDKKRPQFNPILPAMKPTIVFGVRPCEGKSLQHLDKVFGGDDTDPYYRGRRNQTVLVGLACTPPPSAECFCTSVDGSPYAEQGLDILLTDLGDRYFIKSITDKGKDIVGLANGVFEAADREVKKNLAQLHAEAVNQIPRHIEAAQALPAKLKQNFDSAVWDAEAMRCINCGICTYLCPTCHCFDICDEVTGNHPVTGKRVRTWDSCQFPDFTQRSSGHNPRSDKASRLRQRLCHKFQYFFEGFDTHMCIGCGRCVAQCPVGIDIIDVLNKVSADG